MVSVSCFEVVLFESDVRFCRVVVFACGVACLGFKLLMVAGSFRRAGLRSFVSSCMSCYMYIYT